MRLAKVCVLMLAMGSAVGGACSNSNDEKQRAAKLSAKCFLDSECQEPLICAFQRCHEQCTTSRDCPDGQRCVQGSGEFYACQLPDEPSARTRATVGGVRFVVWMPSAATSAVPPKTVSPNRVALTAPAPTRQSSTPMASSRSSRGTSPTVLAGLAGRPTPALGAEPPGEEAVERATAVVLRAALVGAAEGRGAAAGAATVVVAPAAQQRFPLIDLPRSH